MLQDANGIADQRLVLPADAERLRWYVLPSEVFTVAGKAECSSDDLSIQPVAMTGTKSNAGSSRSTCNECNTSAEDTGHHRVGDQVAPELSTAARNEETTTDSTKTDSSDCNDPGTTSSDSGYSYTNIPPDMFISWPPSRSRLQALAASNTNSDHCANGELSMDKTTSNMPVVRSSGKTSPSSSVDGIDGNGDQQRDMVCQVRRKRGNATDGSQPRFVSPPKNIFKPVVKVCRVCATEIFLLLHLYLLLLLLLLVLVPIVLVLVLPLLLPSSSFSSPLSFFSLSLSLFSSSLTIFF